MVAVYAVCMVAVYAVCMVAVYAVCVLMLLLCRPGMLNKKLRLPPPLAQQPPSGPRPPFYRGFMITLGHTSVSRTPLDE